MHSAVLKMLMQSGYLLFWRGKASERVSLWCVTKWSLPWEVTIFCHKAGRKGVPLRTHFGPPSVTWCILRQPESMKSFARVGWNVKWHLGPWYRTIIVWRSYYMGQIVTCLFCKNTSQAHISGYGVFWGVLCSGADLYREQTNKQTENRCIIVRYMHSVLDS